jgi:hypothetical protein
MFRNIGSKVAQGIRQFRTFKPIMPKKNNKSQEFNDNDINKIINKVQNEVEQKEKNNLEIIEKDLADNKII